MTVPVSVDTDTAKIREWRSIVTLIVFVFTNIIVLFPFTIPIYVPRKFWILFLDALSHFRIIPSRDDAGASDDDDQNGKRKPYKKFNFPLNFITAPLIADLFLLAILAIGRQEVHDGTIGANNISPLDVMIFFITLAYIAISIDASGLIRYLAFRVLQWGGKVGHRLFFYLYVFFFALGSFIGNDPIILSGTAFLAYMTRVSSNIVHPRAWIHTQFAVANIASAILVSSNPTNLVLAGAFNIRFIHYTANMIVPVVVTAIVLFPFLLYIVFANEDLIPSAIKMHELPEEARGKKPINPNIPHARGQVNEEENNSDNNEQVKLMSLEEIMNPFLDKGGAAFGAVIMAATLITVLVINAASARGQETPVFYVTLPAAFVMFCWDLGYGWKHRAETRQISRKGRQELEAARTQRLLREEEEEAARLAELETAGDYSNSYELKDYGNPMQEVVAAFGDQKLPLPSPPIITVSQNIDEHAIVSSSDSESIHPLPTPVDVDEKNPQIASDKQHVENETPGKSASASSSSGLFATSSSEEAHIYKEKSRQLPFHQHAGPTTLVSLAKDSFQWFHETFPTVAAVVLHLPFALVPFAFSMFVLVQALATKGWIPVFAHGWDQWVEKTGVVGAIGGMGFLSAVLCNFAGTNIGTTILLSRVIQTWEALHLNSADKISEQKFWGTVYSMALGVNYGAFSTAFSASLAGLLWRDILARKHIHVRGLEFARVNLPIISIAMIVGCVVLTGQIYITRKQDPYNPYSI